MGKDQMDEAAGYTNSDLGLSGTKELEDIYYGYFRSQDASLVTKEDVVLREYSKLLPQFRDTCPFIVLQHLHARMVYIRDREANDRIQKDVCSAFRHMVEYHAEIRPKLTAILMSCLNKCYSTQFRGPGKPSTRLMSLLANSYATALERIDEVMQLEVVQAFSSESAHFEVLRTCMKTFKLADASETVRKKVAEYVGRLLLHQEREKPTKLAQFLVSQRMQPYIDNIEIIHKLTEHVALSGDTSVLVYVGGHEAYQKIFLRRLVEIDRLDLLWRYVRRFDAFVAAEFEGAIATYCQSVEAVENEEVEEDIDPKVPVLELGLPWENVIYVHDLESVQMAWSIYRAERPKVVGIDAEWKPQGLTGINFSISRICVYLCSICVYI